MGPRSASTNVRAIRGFIVFAMLAGWLRLPSPAASGAAEGRTGWKFDFGAGPVAPGFTRVAPTEVFMRERGYGFAAARAGGGGQPFSFQVELPKGNYRVSVTFGDRSAPSSNTVKAESRRLMVERVETAAGRFETRTFTVNVHTPKLPGGGAGIGAANAALPPWDDRLSLEFNGKQPAVAALEIARTDQATTVFLAGDSTVTEQPSEPWAGWGQMLPRFFGDGVAVSNYAHSGLSLPSFESQRRLEKILGVMRPGDYLFIQFGHNDQKDKSPGAGPFTTYREKLEQFVAAARGKGGLPVLVTPMERRRWSPEGKPLPTLGDYAEAVRQTGQEENVPVIDLNAMSLKLYAAFGPEGSKRAFVHYPAGTFPGQEQPLKDDTHHNAYGGYELARCVVEGIKAHVPALAKSLAPGVPAFDPARPDPVETVQIPPSPLTPVEKPAGS